MLLIFRSFKIKSYCLLTLFLFSGSLHAETVLYKYAINLESSQKKSKTLVKLNKFKVDSKYKVYQSEVTLGRGKSFYRLRVGFFASKKIANKVASKFKSKYPNAWVDTLHKQDRKILDTWAPIVSVKTSRVETKKSVSRLVNSKNKEQSAVKLMVRAEQAMKDKKYRIAASLYTRVISFKNTSELQQAMEYLGLAREKNGQLIHARAEYRLYLKKYTSGEDSSRVRQRLLSLNTLLLRPRKRLKDRGLKRSDGRLFGSILQFYRNDVFSSNGNTNNNETLSTNVNLLYRTKTDSLSIKSQFNANNLKYINNDLKDDRDIVNLLFIDVANANNSKSIRLGRQSQNKGGVLGRMDGAWLGYRLSPTWKFNLVAGYPVQTSISNTSQTTRPFVGVSADIGTIAKYWNFNLYTISQQIDGIIDRNAVGGEVRFRKGRQNHFAIVDYDTHFAQLNTFFYVGNWLFANKASINITINHRNSPILTTLNAIQGQTTQSIEELLLTYSESELYQIAQDRTSKYNSFAISSSMHFNDKWSFILDGTISNISSTPASANISAIEGTGDEFFYSAQIIGHNVFNTNETMTFQARYANTKTYERLRLIASTRFRLKNNKLRLRPQISYETKSSSNGAITEKVTSALKMDYKIKRNLKVELDLSYEVGQTDFPVIVNENNYYVSAGFIWDF